MLFGHFWYSSEQRQARDLGEFPSVYALTLRGVREYTEWSSNLLQWHPGGWWSDYRYLGPGLLWRVGGVRQVDLGWLVTVAIFIVLLIPVLLITFWGTAR